MTDTHHVLFLVQKVLSCLPMLNSDVIASAYLHSASFVFCTLCSSGQSILASHDFDFLLVDEAGQAQELESMIPLSLLRKSSAQVMLVGDPNQLPTTLTSTTAHQLGYGTSSLERQMHDFQRPHMLLDTQYRMLNEISAYPNRAFYGGRLKNASPNVPISQLFFAHISSWEKHVTQSMPSCAFIDVYDGIESHEKRNGTCNRSFGSIENLVEAKMVAQAACDFVLCDHSRSRKVTKNGLSKPCINAKYGFSIVVITFYAAQVCLCTPLFSFVMFTII